MPTKSSPPAAADQSLPSLQRSSLLSSTSRHADVSLVPSGAPEALALPDASLVAGDESSEITSGNPPLLNPVARDAREGMPAVLVDSSGPPAGGVAGPGALEPRPSPPIAQMEGDGLVTGNQPISDNQDIHQPIASKAHVATPPTTTVLTPTAARRQVIDLSEIPALGRGTTNTTSPGEAGVASRPSKTYAETLAGATDRANTSKYRAVLTMPSESMLEQLLALAQDDACDDTTMLAAMDLALPYQKKVGTATFWIETGTALQSTSNDKIIASIFEENEDKDWAYLLSNFVQH
ncbi:Aste57867_5498 [Aphanomyces stellatus]|uniref:Aste57867_5498 protein n=1 Tax=Aphanomyces stellatus TaxID=120398 RepID=A0A485KGP1_9STRA|nr:hypothetical protein As57867_005485 [Aphanomyces stellatus]VFT82549.1 Aste57867_5498 [Aphanomyces stellatus]